MKTYGGHKDKDKGEVLKGKVSKDKVCRYRGQEAQETQTDLRRYLRRSRA